ncbi:MAG: MGH1-like glycoside hydrolase domain-containing protein, partial [Streptosporangiaceae bacterium]
MSQLSLAARAAYILRDNSTGVITKAAPALYPHQWSWDAAFNAIGLATVDPPRARLELDSLLRGQWRNGMVPHIVFDPAADGYFPGPRRWACARYSTDAPREVRTSGICQPPVHAIAAARIVAASGPGLGPGLAAGPGRDAWGSLDSWVGRVYPRLLAWHRYLARYRIDPESGLVTLFHGWESGMDNSPRWDAPYRDVRPGPDLPPYTRRDSAHVADAAQRPTDAEYDRYLWLIEEAKRAGYDPVRLRRTGSFQVGDVLFTAIFAAACDDLAGLCALLGGQDAAELRRYAAAARAAVLAHRGPDGLAVDVDVRTGRRLVTETVAGFAPLIAGGLTAADRAHLVATLLGPRWAGHPELRWPLPPSTS